MSSRVYGFLGLGNMGSPMAANIAAAGHDVIGYDAAGTKDRKPEGVLWVQDIQQIVLGLLLSLPPCVLSHHINNNDAQNMHIMRDNDSGLNAGISSNRYARTSRGY